MISANDLNLTLFPNWYKSGLSTEAIQEQLNKMGYPEEEMTKMLAAFRKFRNEKRLIKGFVCAAAGAFCGFLSCVLTLINPIPELYNVILFGFTSVAIGLICLGLYFIFE
jgi:hypothetical protein